MEHYKENVNISKNIWKMCGYIENILSPPSLPSDEEKYRKTRWQFLKKACIQCHNCGRHYNF
jgi:hypothetical protein